MLSKYTLLEYDSYDFLVSYFKNEYIISYLSSKSRHSQIY